MSDVWHEPSKNAKLSSPIKFTQMSKVPARAVWSQIIALIPVYMNVLMVGYSSGWLLNTIYFLLGTEEAYATTSQIALIASCFQFGRILFSIPAGILTDKYGRKKITVIVAFLNFFAWLAISLDKSEVTMCTGRFTHGVAQALITASAIISVGEIASAEIRGQLTLLFQIFNNMGLLIPSIISVLYSSYEILTWSAALFSFITLLSMLWATETPSYLVGESQLKQAKMNLQRIRRGYKDHEINVEYDKLKSYIEEEKIRKSQLSWLTFLQSKSIRKPLLIGLALNCLATSTGHFLIRTYITIIFPPNDIVSTKYYPLINQIFTLFISAIVTLYVDLVPRRALFLLGAAMMTVIHAFCAYSQYLIVEDPNEYIFTWAFLAGNILVIVCQGISLEPMSNALNSEIYPQAVKGLCGSLTNMIIGVIIIFFYQLHRLITDYFDLYLLYIVFLMNSVVLFLIVYFFLPETRGTSLSDLQMQFQENPKYNDGAGIENESKK